MLTTTRRTTRRMFAEVCTSVRSFPHAFTDTGLATACEVLARRVIHVSPPDRITSMLSTRYTHREVDGDEGDKTSALEMAIDSHWYTAYALIEASSLTPSSTVPYFFRLAKRKMVR